MIRMENETLAYYEGEAIAWQKYAAEDHRQYVTYMELGDFESAKAMQEKSYFSALWAQAFLDGANELKSNLILREQQ